MSDSGEITYPSYRLGITVWGGRWAYRKIEDPYLHGNRTFGLKFRGAKNVGREPSCGGLNAERHNRLCSLLFSQLKGQENNVHMAVNFMWLGLGNPTRPGRGTDHSPSAQQHYSRVGKVGVQSLNECY